MTHTPGPWLLDTGRLRRKTIVARTHATAPGAPQFIEIADVLEARATRLLLAAPELLAAAKAALAWYEPRLSPGEEGPICNLLRTAITKAEGREP